MLITAIAAAVLSGADVQSQDLAVTLDPAAHEVSVRASFRVSGEGPLRVLLNDAAAIDTITVDGHRSRYVRHEDETGPIDTINLFVPRGAAALTITYRAALEQDITAGERPGQIHNFSVDAHIGEDGIFLSEGSAWHPQPIDETGERLLHRVSVDVTPIKGWAVVASGDPQDSGGDGPPGACWRWSTPRPAEGMALAGNRHVLHGLVHETPEGPVQVVMHATEAHRAMAPMIVNAAGEYLDLYTALLGPFPYKRFSIVENFFSSGFAFPGFTLIGARVLDRGPLVLRPGLLDHELLHNWWGNGVYVDPADGNWCEALTSYGANYYRRVADEGEAAGREYRMGTLMKLSADPEGLDDGPLGDFGSANPDRGGTSRFVGYDKGAFLLMMLESSQRDEDGGVDRAPLWRALRRFAEANMGRHANWSDLQAAFEAEWGAPLGLFFQRWVREHTVPRTPGAFTTDAFAAFSAQYLPAPSGSRLAIDLEGTGDAQRIFIEIDPEFYCYRVLPPEQIVPLIGGTLGLGGLTVICHEVRPEVRGLLAQLEPIDTGENVMLIGAAALREKADLLARSADPVTVGDGSFTVGGTTYDQPNEAMMHTMAYPGRPGRFITVFLSNGEAGWAKLPLIVHYRRDTTVIWRDGEVIRRRLYEPDRRILAPEPGGGA